MVKYVLLDRLDARVTEYFDTIIFLNNANWDKQRIADFLDKSVSWLEEILRFVPSMDPRVRQLLHEGKISWAKAKVVCRRILEAKPGTEAVADAAIKELESGESQPAPKRVLSPRIAHKRLEQHSSRTPPPPIRSAHRGCTLLSLLSGQSNGDTELHLERVRAKFPGLVD